MTDKRINKLKRKLQEARYRLLTREPELAAPLVEMLFVTKCGCAPDVNKRELHLL